ncbi:hypothetical protein ACFXO9_29800 [Nocardia tengchongensis]|uniref:hypothetical protein n=1 Tax=Nocardia tengchongensis TaxID=2055889 RepID=UPI00367C1060
MPILLLPVSCGNPFRDSINTDLETKPSQYKAGNVCRQFASFLNGNMEANGASYRGTEAETYFENPIEWTTTCVPSTSDGIAGMLQVTNPRLKGTVNPVDSGFQPTKGFDEKVWLSSDHKFRTQVGSWVVEMNISAENIKTPTGTLVLTNEQTRKAVEFIIGVAREVQS